VELTLRIIQYCSFKKMKTCDLWKRLRFTYWPPRLGLRAHLRRFRARWRFWDEYQAYCQLGRGGEMPEEAFFYPCLDDATDNTPVDASYYFQDAWAFEKIVLARPSFHVDVGSHHKFVSLLSKVIPTTMVDLRPLPVTMDSLMFKKGSILELPYDDGTVPSVSSLCVVEHIGLGRYGDPLNPNGTVEAIAELKRIIQPGGDLYISVPLDDVNRIYFNAHRAFTEPYLEQLFTPFEVCERRYIFGTEFTDHLKPGFGTGCYHLRRPSHDPE
jgi:SAM-dependent methyltransferase